LTAPDSIVPGPGGTSLHFVTFPPGSVSADPAFDGEAARSEALSRLRGLADHFEKEDPGKAQLTMPEFMKARLGWNLMTPRLFI
jgi:hypothetical protein